MELSGAECITLSSISFLRFHSFNQLYSANLLINCTLCTLTHTAPAPDKLLHARNVLLRGLWLLNLLHNSLHSVPKGRIFTLFSAATACRTGALRSFFFFLMQLFLLKLQLFSVFSYCLCLVLVVLGVECFNVL